jgi:hypothetical protein
MAIDLKKEVEKDSVPEKKPEKKKTWWNSFFRKKKKAELDSDSETSEKKSLAEIKDKKSLKSSRNSEEKKSSLDISLISEETVIIPRLVRSRLLILVAFFIVILTVFIFVWLYVDWYFEKLRQGVIKAEREIELLEAQTRPLLEVRDEVTELEKRAARTENILNNHIYWTKFFSLLEKYTLAQIYFGDFRADTSGIITLEAVGEDLIAIAQQIVVFSEAKDFIKEVEASGIAQSTDGIRATFRLVLLEDVFKR